MSVYVLGLDPSLTATGWAVLELRSETIVDCGVIRTAPAKASERLYKAEDDARRGKVILATLRDVIARWRPILAAQEASLGSQNARAAAALARAQQACVDAVGELGLEWVTPMDAKVAAAGSKTASKAEVEAGVRERWGWPGWAWDGPKAHREAVADAAAVIAAAWDSPSMRLLRMGPLVHVGGEA